MIPDTLNYMIAGYIVIGSGILLYLSSLIIRSIRVKQKLEKNKQDLEKH